MKGVRLLFSLFVLIFAIQLASANFLVDLNSTNIKQIYNLGDEISGNIAITFVNESIDSVITINLGTKKTTVDEWIKRSGRREGIDYNCSFTGCAANYQSKGAINDLIVSSSQPKIFGFKASGSNVTIESLSFVLKSSLANSCTKPFSIDALNAGNYIFESYEYANSFCQDYRQGCFDYTLSAGQYQIASLTNTPYCEKIRLSPAPAYVLGVNLTRPANAVEESISMQLYNGDFTVDYGNCSFVSSNQNYSCVMPYPITQEGDYFVCVLSNMSNSPSQIRTEFVGSICGSANYGQSLSRDFDVYVRALEYSDRSMVFNSDSFALLNNEQNFTAIANQFLAREYGSNCLKQDCFLPFKIIGGVQQMFFSNASLTYKSDGVPVSDNFIHIVEKTPSSVRSGRMVLSLAELRLNISQPGTLLQINIGNRTLIRTNVSVVPSPISITPTFALIGVPATFSIKSNETITSASWKFSNEAVAKSGLTVKQTFPQSGTYTVDVTATTVGGKTYTKNQQISVGEPKASAEELYQLSQQAISSVASDINSLPSWIASDVRNKVNVITLNNSLKSIEEKMRYASNNTEYAAVIEELRALNVPSDISISRTGNFPIITGYGNLNLNYVSSIYQVENTEALIPVILEWTNENYNAQIELTSYSKSMLDGSTSPLLTRVKVTASPKSSQLGTQYLIIDYPLEALKFMSGYSQKELQGGTYIPLDSAKTIEFYAEQELTLETLGMYILPSLEQLKENNIEYEIVPSQTDSTKNVTYILLGILFVGFIIVVIALQYWYRHNYEKYLYPDEEGLFNVMTFIYNSKKKGLKEGDIRKSLVSSGWRREQINYALGRFEGKILGLFGLPIYSAREEQKVRERIESKQRQNTGRKVY